MPKTNLNDLPGDWVAGASEMENRNPSDRDARRAGRGDEPFSGSRCH
jgi:hypothetical protein